MLYLKTSEEKLRREKMTVDNTFMIKKLQRLEEMLVVFSQFTRMPFAECDEETFDDQIHIFTDETKAQEFAKAYLDKKILLVAVKVPKNQMKGFYVSLYSMGINAVLFHEGNSATRIQLEELEKKPDIEALGKEKIPVINSSLQLSAIYFIQELRRPVEHDMKHLHDLEEEMIANFVKSKFIIGMEVVKEKETDKEQVRIPYVKDKEGNVFQPVFTDFAEFQKHYKKNAVGMKMAPLTIFQLPQYLVKESKGFVINPSGFNLQLSKEQIEIIIKAFPEA